MGNPSGQPQIMNTLVVYIDTLHATTHDALTPQLELKFNQSPSLLQLHSESKFKSMLIPKT